MIGALALAGTTLSAAQVRVLTSGTIIVHEGQRGGYELSYTPGNCGPDCWTQFVYWIFSGPIGDLSPTTYNYLTHCHGGTSGDVANAGYFLSGTQTTTVQIIACSPNYPEHFGEVIVTASMSTIFLPSPDPPPLSGPQTDLPCPSKQCETVAGAPINLANGNTWIEQSDLSIPGLGGGLSLTRTWNSIWTNPNDPPVEQVGLFGDSWRSNFEERLQAQTGGGMRYWRGDGSRWTFSYDSVNQVYNLTSPPDEHASLVNTAGQFTLTFKDGRKRIFNNGYLTAVQDRNGNQTTLQWDTSTPRKLLRVTDASGRYITFTYGDTNNPHCVTNVQYAVPGTDPPQFITLASYAYYPDTAARIKTITYPDQTTVNFDYDPNSNTLITRVYDGAGKDFEKHTYDSYRRGLTSGRAVVDSSGIPVDSVTLSYSASITNLTDSKQHVTQYGFQSIGGRNFIALITGSGCASCGGRRNSFFGYDSSGNRTYFQDARGNQTNYNYDPNGNISSATSYADHPSVSNFTYTSFGEVLTATDPLGNVPGANPAYHTTTYTYYTNGDLHTVTTPSPDNGTTTGSLTQFVYDAGGKGLLTQVIDPKNHTTSFGYAPDSVCTNQTNIGLMATATNALNKTTKFCYDAFGNRTDIYDALNSRHTALQYDSRNRLKQITYPDNTTVVYHYDAVRGRLDLINDQNGHQTKYVYDDADRLTSVIQAAETSTPIETDYKYDTENNITDIIDALHRDTNFSYNNFGSLAQVTFPGSPPPIENLYYDDAGNLSQLTDRINQGGNSFLYTYDNMNRLKEEDTPGFSNVITYSYDQASRLKQVQDSTGTYSFSYDNMNRVTQATTAYPGLGARSFSYTYDPASNRATMSSPDLPASTTYTYDALNRLQNILDFNNNLFDFGYDDIDRPTSLTRHANNVNTTYAYKPNTDFLQSILHQAGSTTLDGASYIYDNAGNRLSAGNGASLLYDYSYDDVYQLTYVATHPPCPDCPIQLLERYGYDAVGNRLTDFSGATYVYNNPWNHLDSKGSTSFTYDANGNTKTKGATTYNWNSLNQLASAALPGGNVSFKYDPFGRRIQKSSAAGTINYLYDGSNVIEEVDSSGTQLARYSQGSGIDQPLSMARGGATSFYQGDGLGSVTSLTNASGLITDTYAYDSSGNLTTSSGTTNNSYRYAGREWDSETGLYYYRARYYDPQIGRFLSEDPGRFSAGVNFYEYAGNNPVVFTDPSGLRTKAKSSTWSGLDDLLYWLFGNDTSGNFHSDDAVTAALAKSPATADIRDKFKKKNCQNGLYCGDFKLRHVFTTLNVVVQSVGSFCAYITNIENGEIQIDAFNEWGFKSLTNNPWGNRAAPSLIDMVRHRAHWGKPGSLLNNTKSGPMQLQRFWYHWTEKSPCCDR